MTTPDYRALCAEFVSAVGQLTSHGDSPAGPGHRLILTADVDELEEIATRARAALAQPEPEGLTDEEIAKCLIAAGVDAMEGESDGTNRMYWEGWHEQIIAGSRAVIAVDRARWGRPVIEPVPTPEPGTADHITDDEGTRWDRTTDAALWAKAFCLICPEMASREDVMIGWFANAIMAGCDHQAWKIDAERKPVPVSERPWEREGWCDAEGRCWWGRPSEELCNSDWFLATRSEVEEFCEDCLPTVSLPHYALPVPEVTP
jgi:hypothetical protein